MEKMKKTPETPKPRRRVQLEFSGLTTPGDGEHKVGVGSARATHRRPRERQSDGKSPNPHVPPTLKFQYGTVMN